MKIGNVDLKNEIIELDKDIICPSCGSEEVVIEASEGYFLVVFCRECEYSIGG